MSEEICLLTKKGTGAETRRIFMYSKRGDVLTYHLKYSILPFINRYRELLGQMFPEGLTLVDASERVPANCDKDYYLCFEPAEKNKDFIISSLSRFNSNNCIMINYENTIAYHYRAWRMTDEFCSNFKYIFSSASIFADNQKYFWIPNWNFLTNFETGQLIYKDKIDNNCYRKLLAINPIRSGMNVNPDRLKIIKNFMSLLPEAHIFGVRALFEEHGEFSNYKSNYAGEIPYSSEPYRFLEKIKAFQNYKFTLVIENTFTDGYISEKLAEPLMALSIPIYYGNPNLDTLLPNLSNKAIINGHDFKSENDLISYLKNLSNNEYYDYIERIIAYRSEYLELTSRYNIWDFILRKTLLNNQLSSGLINDINIKYLDYNNRLENIKLQKEIIHLIELGNYPNNNYENKIRDLFRKLA
jgi:hypothetical protein